MPIDEMSGSEDGQLRSPIADDHMLRYVYSKYFVLMDDCCYKTQNHIAKKCAT